MDCKARVIVKNNDFEKARLVKDHSHEPDKIELDRAKFSKTLDKICQENPHLKPLLCYTKAKEQLKGQIDRKNIDMSSFYNTFMHRKQKLHVPLLPKTIIDFKKLIEQPQNSKRFAYDDCGNVFYRGVWRGATGDNIAFVSERTLGEVKKMEKVTLLMDGTFKALPLHMKFCQLYIISVIQKGRCYPLAFILMERRDYKSYMNVFHNLKQLIPTMNVVTLMSDYEAATRKAAKIQFPNARLSGCFFHYVQGIRKASKRFGLRSKWDKVKFEDVINKVSALALLPNEYVVDGFKSISRKIKKNRKWRRFEKYWMKQWAKANISVYGLPHRTNNFAESLNRNINLLNIERHPNIWKLLYNLKTVDMLKSDELEQVVAGLIVKCKRKRKTIRMNKDIEEATIVFDETEDVESFLNTVTFRKKWSEFFGISGSFYDNEFAEEVIPNDFNKKNNFRRRTAVSKRKISHEDPPKKKHRK